MGRGIQAAVEITGVKVETPSVRTFSFSRDIDFLPGQFVMVWVPGVDEVPMALSSSASITVQNVGDATGALFGMQAGDVIGIRGPFGNGFPTSGKILCIAGGVGAAPLRSLIGSGSAECLLLGARKKEELLFVREFSSRTRILTATDDGSAGHFGPVTALLPSAALPSFNHICVCGPERMMYAVLLYLKEIGIPERGYFSLHRYMKCGIGLCGSCCIDPSGFCVCREGPVFTGDLLLCSEFGHYARDASGRRRPV